MRLHLAGYLSADSTFAMSQATAARLLENDNRSDLGGLPGRADELTIEAVNLILKAFKLPTVVVDVLCPDKIVKLMDGKIHIGSMRT